MYCNYVLIAESLYSLSSECIITEYTCNPFIKISVPNYLLFEWLTYDLQTQGYRLIIENTDNWERNDNIEREVLKNKVFRTTVCSSHWSVLF